MLQRLGSGRVRGTICGVENVNEVRAVEVRAVEVRYAGVVVGRSTRVRDWDSTGAFIGFAEPLPTGTSLVLRGDGVDQPARVTEVFESADPAVVGMQVKFSGAAEAARPGSKPAAAEAKPVPAAVTAPAPAAASPSVPVAVVEAAPVEAAEAPLAAVAGELTGSTTSEQGEGDAGQVEQSGQLGQSGQAGKRRRRRR
jgi:hypothetical protein